MRTGAIELLPAEYRVPGPRVMLEGLGVRRRVATAGRDWPAPGKRLVSETGERRAPRFVTSEPSDAGVVIAAVTSGGA